MSPSIWSFLPLFPSHATVTLPKQLQYIGKIFVTNCAHAQWASHSACPSVHLTKNCQMAIFCLSEKLLYFYKIWSPVQPLCNITDNILQNMIPSAPFCEAFCRKWSPVQLLCEHGPAIPNMAPACQMRIFCLSEKIFCRIWSPVQPLCEHMISGATFQGTLSCLPIVLLQNIISSATSMTIVLPSPIRLLPVRWKSFVSQRNYSHTRNEDSFVVMLDHMRSWGNMGSPKAKRKLKADRLQCKRICLIPLITDAQTSTLFCQKHEGNLGQRSNASARRALTGYGRYQNYHLPALLQLIEGWKCLCCHLPTVLPPWKFMHCEHWYFSTNPWLF